MDLSEEIKKLDAIICDEKEKLLYKTIKVSKDNEIIQLMKIDRLKCIYGKGDYERVLLDAPILIKELYSAKVKNNQYYECLVRIIIIRTLLTLNRHKDVDGVIQDWVNSIIDWLEPSDNRKALLHTIQNAFSSLTTRDITLVLPDLETDITMLIGKCKIRPFALSSIRCIYCNLEFDNDLELESHCKSQEHITMVMSDEGREWLWRTPPRGSDKYKICKQFKEIGSCLYGAQCIDAHGEEELAEWQERYLYRRMKIQRATDNKLFGKSYTEQLLEKWGQSRNPSEILKESIAEILEESCSSPYSTYLTAKNDNHQWIFSIKTKRPLKAVALLQDTYRCHFDISSIAINGQIVNQTKCQEYIFNQNNVEAILQYDIIIIFHTMIYGTFRQSVVFDCGTEPALVKHLCVDVVPTCDLDRINKIKDEFIVSIAERWTHVNSVIISFNATGEEEAWESYLKATYPCPDLRTFQLSNDTLSGARMNRNNYKNIMHELLYIEEIERYNLVSKYNLTTKLRLAHSYILAPNMTASNTTKYASGGELFASIHLGKELSEDTAEGRLIFMHCKTVYICPLERSNIVKVYEAIVEDKGKNTIYLRLSSVMVEDLQLTTDTDIAVQIQFQLNRVPYGEWHYAIDKISNVKLLFPDTYINPNIHWSPSRQWSETLDRRLNARQKDAIIAITTPLSVKLPPILINGPYGTGKTFTLAHAIKELIRNKENKILLCTHSNSAADLYIKDYLDNWVEKGNESARPLRIYYKKRWVSTVSAVVQKYCCIGQNGEFQMPNVEDVLKHNIVVVTLSTSVLLLSMNLPLNTFTHILVDEAAQALECEMITPLGFATDKTRIVLAGDHMQLSPQVFSKFTKDRGLHVSLLERLYDHYPASFSCKISLSLNYRAQEDILNFTSEAFYDTALKSSNKQKPHPTYFPLTFFTTRGEDLQCQNSTGFYNNSEVYEIVERVVELKENWPDVWGPMDEHSIGVVTPYYDQVFRIRTELRKRKIDVCVERVQNVQGKQFRVILLSTVRTRNTCIENEDLEYGFLSDLKLLNTAITRAQSLVAVAGDPIALCTVGRCSKIWESFLYICYKNKSLHGMKWNELRSHVDAIELKRTYGLNPLAPEFVPRRKTQVLPLYLPPVQNCTFTPSPMYAAPPKPRIPFPIYRPPVIPFQPSFPPPPSVPPPPITVPRMISPFYSTEAQLLNDCIHLLPKNMTLIEMMLQPLDFQQHWYNYLKNTLGVLMADKFLFLIRSLNQRGTQMPQTNLSLQDSFKQAPQLDKTTHIPTKKSNPLYERQGIEPHIDNNVAQERQCDDEKQFNQKINEYFAGLALDLGIDR